MTNPISLSDRRKAKENARSQDNYEKRKILTRATLTSYKKLYHIILRQTGKENYAGEPHDNPVGESLFYELLTSEQKINLEKILNRLEGIIRIVEAEVNELRK